jgi:dipeptidase E
MITMRKYSFFIGGNIRCTDEKYSYTSKVKQAFGQWGYDVTGIHSAPNPIEAVEQAEAIFIGGGNTFRLLSSLYRYNLVSAIRQRVSAEGL